MESEITVSPSASVIPRTPMEVRLWKTRTSVTGKRMHWPPAEVSRTSSRSVQIATFTMPSPSSSFMAIMPERRTSTKSESLLRRTVPRVVANITSSSAHVFALDQVFLLHLPFLVYDPGAPRRGKFAPHGSQLVLDDGLDTRPRAQDV